MGTIPSEFEALSDLQELDLSGNFRIEGVLPKELALLDSLTRLDVSGTSITGEVPVGLCTKSNLSILANCTLLQCC